MKKIIITILLLIITYLIIMLVSGRIEQIEKNENAFNNTSVKLFER